MSAATATSEKPRLKGLTEPEMEALTSGAGFDAYRGRQLFLWVQRKNAQSVEEMKNLPTKMREWLAENTTMGGVAKIHTVRESADGSFKFLFQLEDGKQVESVLMVDPIRNYWTQCLSSQVGCAVDCKFCVTGFNGFFRQLRVDEIVDQVLTARKFLKERHPDAVYRNLVYMGMGEPLLNTDAVIASLKIVTHTNGLDLSGKRITVSTSGIIPGMIQLSESGVGVCLALSLNGTNEKERTSVMPITKKYPLADVLEVCRKYPYAKNKRVCFEYVMLAGVNDTPRHAKEMVALLRSIPCKINLIPFNPSPLLPYDRPTRESVEEFARILGAAHYAVSVRWSKALDVDGACGQLAGPQNTRKKSAAAGVATAEPHPGEPLGDLDFFATVAAETANEEEDEEN